MATRIEKTDLARDALYDKVNTMIDEVNTKIDNKDSLPSQTGNAGKFLTTDGTNASWGEVKQIEIKQDLTNPSPDTVPSTKAVKDESSRITTLMNTKVSNCITEIPQDIKLELNKGTLTLKAGSKVYVPNGAGKFDTVTIASDKTKTVSAEGKQVIFLNSGENLQSWDLPNCFSGSTAPMSTHYPMWYDTRNNIIKSSNDYGSTWSGKFSFPICVVTVSNGTITSIDQVFNGFGYIGSTIFALPGVKGLIPNGRNADGSLKSIDSITTKVNLLTFSTDTDGTTEIVTANNWIGESIGHYSYNSESNFVLFNFDKITGYMINSCKVSHGRITSFTPKTVFHALDYNDKSRISGWSMPSDRYIDLTLGANGSTYTAPANGWFAFARRASAVGQFFNVSYISPAKINFWSDVGAGAVGNILGHLVPVQKGQIVGISYNAGGDIIECRFIYAEGDKPSNVVSSSGGGIESGGIESGGIESGGIESGGIF